MAEAAKAVTVEPKKREVEIRLELGYLGANRHRPRERSGWGRQRHVIWVAGRCGSGTERGWAGRLRDGTGVGGVGTKEALSYWRISVVLGWY